VAKFVGAMSQDIGDGLCIETSVMAYDEALLKGALGIDHVED
jgi:hypothetical protein